ncbi:unnamed protein product [Aspergillus oryzae RIB40]|uniref:DNA, SC103 n=1 Tax=Aspergillus oryzae (strain ATCC 42149 / RIB 40) TaxID=510516 RepID=Q2TYK6_ASPOR|nr:unnamed protein product [Aspergillus oryzae RIB40]BAE65667.1 unnamed protein product [Aspergillus oryzae RIB40]
MIGIYVYNSCYFKDYVEATNIGGYLDRKTYGIWRSTSKTVVWVRPTVRFPVSILPPAEEIGNVFHGLHTETSFRRKCTTFGTGPYGGVESTILVDNMFMEHFRRNLSSSAISTTTSMNV